MRIDSFSISALPVKHSYHNHCSYECHYIIAGEGRAFHKGREEDIGPDSFIFYAPGESHYLQSRDRKSRMIQILWQFIPDSGDSDFRNDLESLAESGRVYSPGTKLIGLFERIRYLASSSCAIDVKRAQLLLKLYFYSLMKGEKTLPDLSENMNSVLNDCIDSMYRNIRSDFSIKDYAVKAGISPSYLIRLFKRDFQKTPYSYYLELKIEAASEYMIQSGETLDIVAEKFGFTDRFHFSRVFKKQKGVSPSSLCSRIRGRLPGSS